MRATHKSIYAVLFMFAVAVGAARADNVVLISEFSCRDVGGVPVVLQWMPRHEEASIVNAVPVIQLDPQMIDRLPPIVAAFLYFHECGHHALGHVAAAAFNGPYFVPRSCRKRNTRLTVLVWPRSRIKGQVLQSYVSSYDFWVAIQTPSLDIRRGLNVWPACRPVKDPLREEPVHDRSSPSCSSAPMAFQHGNLRLRTRARIGCRRQGLRSACS